ncbi:MAG: hypothetical protein IT301_07060 [Dehalococcoidia bacterium]|nr:hypothetical protein [Dehalococcoidia bacterium]
MFNQPYALQHMTPGEPTPAALHREEYYHGQPAPVRTAKPVIDSRMQRRARLLRAQMITAVGRYFA